MTAADRPSSYERLVIHRVHLGGPTTFAHLAGWLADDHRLHPESAAAVVTGCVHRGFLAVADGVVTRPAV